MGIYTLFEYNKETYRQKTKAAWDKAVSATYGIWNKQDYSIEYQNDTQKEYFTFEYPTYGDFVTGKQIGRASCRERVCLYV